MTPPSRTTQFEKLYKVLKKHYKPFTPDPNRSVLEHLLLGCCLENAGYQAAEAALAALTHEFFDLNEVRVSTVRELSEVISGLPEPAAAAGRVKRVLQCVFEGSYAFDLEEVRKLNLGPAIERLQKVDGATPFAVAYVVQSALGGHSIPIDGGTMSVLRILDFVSEDDAAAGAVPGLERAISKSKGVEFGSLLHQLGADFTANPYSPALHEILLAVNPEAQSRLPKRRSPKKAVHAAPALDTPDGDGGKTPSAKPAVAGPPPGGRAAEEPAAAAVPQAPGEGKEDKKEAAAKAARPKKKAAASGPGAAAPRESAAPAQEGPPPEPASTKPPAKKEKEKEKEKEKPAAAKKKVEPPKPKASDEPADKASPSAGLSKKKPR